MLENINGVKIKGGRFTEETSLQDCLKRPFNIIYGTNGSGKSTLAKALHDYDREDRRDDFELEFIPDNNEVRSENVHVFNEDFINSRMKVTEDTGNNSLNTIVMFGEQIETNNSVDEINKQITELEKEIEVQQAVRQENDTDELREKLGRSLRNNDFDLGKRLQQINVRETVYRKSESKKWINHIIEHKDDYVYSNVEDMLTAVNTNIQKIEDGKGQETYYWDHSKAEVPFDVEAANALLAKTIQRPELDERDEYLVGMTEQMMAETQQVLSGMRGVGVCPICRQQVSEEHRSHILALISQRLNKEYEEYVEGLKSMRDSIQPLDYYEINLPSVTDSEKAEYKNAINEANKELQKAKEIIAERCNDPYGKATAIDGDALQGKIDALNAVITRLEEKVEEFNMVVRNIKEVKEEAEENAKNLAYLEHRSEFDKIVEMDGKALAAFEAISECQNKLEAKKKELKELQASKKNSKVAMDFINECLDFVFANDGRLRLAAADNCYRVMVNNGPVDIRNVSTGERNIMALAYFFATIFEEKNERYKYRDEMLVVLDDPVSSFDYSNRAGVLSFLQNQIREIVTGNRNSKVLLITHDAEVAVSLRTMYNQDIRKIRNSKFRNDLGFNMEPAKEGINMFEDVIIPPIYELYNGHMSMRETKSDYENYLNTVYNFAKAENPNINNYSQIGNTIRQMLETYANWMYKINYTKLLQYGTMLKYLVGYPEGKQRKNAVKKLSAMAFRYILNSQSHSDTLNTMETFHNQFSINEIQRCARLILIYIARSNEMHLYSFLNDEESTVRSYIDEWDRQLIG